MGYLGNAPADQAIQIGSDTILSSHIDDGVIVNADVNASAAIATSKLSGALTSVSSHGLATSATTDTTSASNISSGTLAAARVATLNQNTTGTAATVTGGTQASITSTANLVTVGTIGTGVWNGTAVASAYLDADTAHLTTAQTFTGAKTFSGANGSAKIALTDSTNSKTITFETDDGNLHIDTHEGVSKFIFTQNAKLGIGTTSPATALHAESASNAVITWKSTDGSNTKTYHLANDATRAWMGSSDTSIIQSWTPAGNVGIGTASPGATVFSSPASATTPTVLEIQSVDSSTDVGIMLSRGTDYVVGMDMWCDISTGINYIDQRYNADGGDLIFRTKTNGTAINAMTIDGLGKVGIGTTSPACNLEVEGAGAVKVRVDSSDDAGDATLELSSDRTFQIISKNSDNRLDIEDISNDKIVMTILGDASGNVGIGETSPASLLHIKDPGGYDGGGSANAILIRDDESSNQQQLSMGVNTSGLYGYIQTSQANVGFNRLKLQPQGGLVSIGGANPNDYSSSANNLVVGTGTGSEGITILGGDDAESNIFFADGTDSAGKALPGYVNYKHDTNMMRFQTNGGVRLTISNDGTFVGSSSADISDRELKKNIKSITNGIDTIKLLKGRTFEWKVSADMQEGTQYGLIAQELEEVLPDLVYDKAGIREKEDGSYYKSITMSGVIPVLIEAIKELSSKVEALENA